jgi:hypothetical protein
LAQLGDCPASRAADLAAEALSDSGEAISVLAERGDFNAATLWTALGMLGEAYAVILPLTSNDLPDPPVAPGALVREPRQLVDVLGATAAALDRATRAATEPDRILALARAADLTDRARRVCVTALAAA